MKHVFLLAMFFALLLSACGGAQTADQTGVIGKDAGGYRDISAQELEQMLENKDFTMVNVHIPFEGDLPNTDLSIPYDQITQHLDELPEKDAKIVLYCRSDNMSNTAAKALVELGYTNLYNLDGGFNAWKAAGLPMAGE